MLRTVPTPLANPDDGEVLLEVTSPTGAVLEAFVLRMKTNAVCRLEQAMGEHVHKLGARLTNPGMQDLRCLLFAALSDRHPGMTINDAGNLIDRCGFDACVTAVMEAFALGFPKAVRGAAAEVAAADKGKDRGTGSGSLPMRRKRASAQQNSGS